MFRLKVVAFVLLATVAVALALAQSSSSGMQQGTTEGQAARHERTHDRLEWLSKELNLSDEQKEKLKPILHDEAKQMRAVHEDSSLTPDQKRDKIRQIHKTSRPQIQAVLTPEQQEKFKNLREEAREKRQQSAMAGGQAAEHERRHDRLEWLSKELNLSDEQKEKLKPILQDEGKQMRAVHEDSSLTPDQKRDKIRQIHKTSRPQIQAVLTPEQQEKFKNLREEAREKRQGKEETKQ